MNSPGSLTYEEIRETLATLPDRSLQLLADGPLPDLMHKECCRVCSVLSAFKRKAPVERLLEWHDFIEKGFSLLGAVCEHNYKEEIEESLVEEITNLMGTLSYSRCLIIYSCAAAELEGRRRQRLEDGLDVNGEPPDERAPDEKRADEEAEDADRQLDAERVGDR